MSTSTSSMSSTSTSAIRVVDGTWSQEAGERISQTSQASTVIAATNISDALVPTYPQVARLPTSSTVAGASLCLPPPYSPIKSTWAELPTYEDSEECEPVTFARQMFWLGIVFPFFWIAGIFLLWSPLRAPASWDDEEEANTFSSKELLLQNIREAELKWAYRCLWALLLEAGLALVFFSIVKFSILRS